MINKKKILWEILFLLLVFVGTLYGVFHGEDLGEIIRIIHQIQKAYLIPAVVCVFLFVGTESIIIRYLMGTLGIRLKKWICFLFSAVGFFFSCITPSASGGQPAQLIYMRRSNIPVPVATLVLMVVTITYKSILVIWGLGMIVFGQSFLHIYLSDILPVFYLGIALNVICVGLMLMLLFHTALTRVFLFKSLALLEKLHIVPYRQSLHQRLDNAIQKYQNAASYFLSHRHVILNVLAATFFQRFALFLSTYFVYRAFGLQDCPVMTIVTLQAAISIAVDMLPLPGGMGISERLFLTIFLPVFGQTLLLPGMILSRGLSYYTELHLCTVFTIVAHFTITEKNAV